MRPSAPAGGLFVVLWPRYINRMSDPPGTVYQVMVLDGEWRRLLTTQDKAQAEALLASIIADGVEAKIEKFKPGDAARHK